jgi:hypothetical protein
MNAYIWTRESNKYDKTVYSLTSQVEKCLAAARADGLAVPDENIYRVKFSGRDLFKIPELRDLFARLEAEPTKKKRVYCYSQDRMVRGETGADIFYITTRFRHAGAELILYQKPKDFGTIAGQIETLVDGHAASEEIGKILDRTMRGKLTRIRSGKIQNFGPEKYGHIRDKATGTATHHPDQAPIVRRLFDWVLAGESLHECCRRLNEAGVPRPRGGRWHLSGVVRILSDPAHCDQARLWRVERSGNVTRQRPDADHIPLTGVYQPIVTPEEFQLVQSKLSRNRGAKKRNQARPALLRGLVICRRCGRPCYVTPASGATYYRCASQRGKRVDPGAEICRGKAIRVDWLDEAVWRAACDLLRAPEEIAEMDKQSLDDGSGELRAELAMLAQVEKQKLTQQGNLVRALRDAEPGVAGVIKVDIGVLQAEISGLTVRRLKIERELGRQVGVTEQRQAMRSLIAEAVDHLDQMVFTERRAVLEGMGFCVKIDRPEWEIYNLS